MALEHGMIEPFEDRQVRDGVVSYGLSSYGYDIRVGSVFKIFTNVNSIRTADPEELAARYVELYGKMAQVAPNLPAALEIAYRAVTKEDLICITGSFYLVGEAKKLFAAKNA